MTIHEEFMTLALEQAKIAMQNGDVPVGAVVAKNSKLICTAYNMREQLCDPTAHAEILAIQKASKILGKRRLNDCILYVTLEPCPMCAGAMVMANLYQCFFATSDEKQGCCQSVYAITQDPAFSWNLLCVGGIMQKEAKELLDNFFSERRSAKKYKE